MHKRNNKTPAPGVSLRTVAKRAGVAPCTVSAVLNGSPASRVIPQLTKDRILRAVRDLSYRPSFAARCLRTKRSYTVAAVAPDVGEPQAARTIAAAEFVFRQNGYMLILSSCGSGQESLKDIENRLLQRGVEGILFIDLDLRPSTPLPATALKHAGLQKALSALTTTKWLEERAQSAARALLAQLEKKKAASQTHPPIGTAVRWLAID